MTTAATQQNKSPEPRFSYAAAASGKQSQMPSAVQSSTSLASESPAMPAQTTVNGTSPAKEVEPVPSKAASPENASDSKPSTNEKPSTEKGNKSKQPTVEAIEDDQPNGWDNKSQVSGTDKEKVQEAPKKEFVLAPEPAVNYWKVRQETQAAKNKTAPVTAVTAAPASKSPAPGAAAHKSEKSEKPRKKTSKQNSNELEGPEKPVVGEKKDGKATRKPSEGKERPNGTFNREEGGKPKAAKPKPQETTTPALPPPLHDTTLWPTPESAKDEKERRAREEKEREKEKPATASTKTDSSKQTWVPLKVPITVNYPPGTDKSGRPSRGGRGGARGGASSRGGRTSQKWDGQAGESTAESDRGRANQPEKPVRGGYSGRGGKRASSAGNNAQQRPSNEGFAAEPAKQAEAPAANGTNWESSKPVPTAAPFVPHSTAQAAPSASAKTEEQGSVPSATFQPERNQSFNSSSFPLSPTTRSDAPFEQPNQYYYPRERGGMGSGRGYRGRGGHYGHGGHHQSGPSTPNTAGFQGMPYNQNRGGFKGPRSHSVPGSATYLRYGPQVPGPYPMGYPHVYDYNAMPVPQSPAFMNTDYLVHCAQQQIDYYFSVDNLCKDLYLRKHMNSEGYVNFDFIANFNRVKQLTQDANILKEACIISEEVELARGTKGDGIRRKKGWEQFLLKPEDRDPSAKEDNGPWRIVTWQEHQHIAHGIRHGETHFQQQLPANTQPYTPYPPNPALTIVPNGVNGTGPHSGHPLSADVPPFTPSSAVTQTNGLVEDEDRFSDSLIESLIIVCKRSSYIDANGTGAEAEGARPSSKGSIDGRTISDELLKYEISSRSNGDVPSTSSTEETRFYPQSPRVSSPSLAFKDLSARQPEVGWYTKDVNSDGTNIPYIDYLIHKQYTTFKLATLEKRAEGSVGDITILYRFWRHFLMEHFNRNIYNEFKQLALEDLAKSNELGFNYLLKYYADTHLYKNPTRLASKDFVELAKSKQAHAMDMLKAVLVNPKLPATVKSQLDTHLDAELRKTVGV